MTSTQSVRRRLNQRMDQLSAGDFTIFLRRVLATVAPAAVYSHNWHIEAIAAHLHACARGDIRRLVINMPPRMLKSTLVSVAWPAWLLGHEPALRLMAASYGQALANKHSQDCRLVMQAPWYRRIFPETRLSARQNEKEKFATTRQGYRIATSVGGAATGEGGHILIVDDPLNALQAGQHAQRETVNAWFDHTFATRLDDKQRGAIVVVMQRLHVDDLSGYLLERGGWHHLNLPAIAPVDTLVRCGAFSYARPAGEALHAAREPLALLEQVKGELGSTNFSAQYQQQPIQREGALLRPFWFKRFEGMPEGSCVQSWDTAVKAGDGHDASACATFVVQDGVHHLVDMLVARLEYPALKRAICNHAARFSPVAVLMEDKASGQSLLQELRGETELPLIARMPVQDKISRMERVTPMMEAGQVALPKVAGWLAALEEELFRFPDSGHDDQADAISQYLNWVRERGLKPKPNLRRL